MGRKVANGGTLKVTISGPATINKGDFIVGNGVLGMALQSAVLTSGTKDIVILFDRGVYETSQVNTSTFNTLGTKVYWNNSSKQFTATAGSNKLVGVLTGVKTNGSIKFLYFPTIIYGV